MRSRLETPKIGILALQGDVEAHRKVLEERLGIEAPQVRTPAELAEVDALILPGGESTTLAKLMERIGLTRALQERARAGMPVYGTCAGLILMASEIDGRPEQPTLKLLDASVARNASGRQIDSFEADIPFGESSDGASEVRGVFIRAPYVTRTGPAVHVLSRFQNNIVAVRQGNLFGTAFHPELTDDTRVHEYFLSIVKDSPVR